MDFGRIVGNLPGVGLTSGFFYCKDEIWKFWAKLSIGLVFAFPFLKTFSKKKVTYITVVHLALPGEGDVSMARTLRHKYQSCATSESPQKLGFPDGH